MASIPIIASLPGKTALITEASQSPGYHVTRELAAEGANLALHYTNPAEHDTIEALSQELQVLHSSLAISTHQGDLTTAEGIDALFASVLQEHSSIDFVVKQDGAMARRAAGDVSVDDSHRVLAYALFVDSQRRIWTERCNEAMAGARTARPD